MKKLALFIFGIQFIVIPATVSGQKKNYPYQNPKLAIEERVENLLSLMTLEEKINQLTMKSLNALTFDNKGQVTTESLEKLFGGESIGCLESPFIEHEKIVKISEAVDKYLREKTRLGIPAIHSTDCLHGQMAIFPQAIGLGVPGTLN